MFNPSSSKRRTTLPIRNPYHPTSSSSSSSLKSHAHETRPSSLRVTALRLLSRPKWAILVLVGVLGLLGWLVARRGGGERVRMTGGSRVVARDWEEGRTVKLGRDGVVQLDETILVRFAWLLGGWD